MDLTQLANLGEFIGGVAVIASLLYVGLQVRQNTRAMRVNAFQTFSAVAGHFAEFIASNTECLKTFRVGLESPESLPDEDERMRFGMILDSLYRNVGRGSNCFVCPVRSSVTRTDGRPPRGPSPRTSPVVIASPPGGTVY